MRVIVAAGAASAALYLALAALGDLAAHPVAYLAGHALLLALMLVAWRAIARGPASLNRVMLGAAVAFRLIAACASPTLSHEIYRSVWDGRVQAAGHHPYECAPADPMRAELRDPIVYPRIDHPERPTAAPPLAEMTFAVLALVKLGVTGFKIALGLIDVLVILALARLARLLGRPPDRIVLYAWNPLAVIETAGSGHVTPLGILFVLLMLGWLVEGKTSRAGAALGAAIQSTLLPLLLVPGCVRRMKAPALAAFAGVVVITTAPYALRGPWHGGGLGLAHTGEHGAVLFELIRRLLAWLDPAPTLHAAVAWAQGRWGTDDTSFWEKLYALARPEGLARVVTIAGAVVWAIVQSFRRQPDVAHEARLVLGGAILLAPALEPWHVLWVLPLAVLSLAGGWILLAALVPLQYAASALDVPWGMRLLIVVPALAWMARDSLVRSRR